MKFSPTNMIKFKPMILFVCTFFALQFVISGAIHTNFVMEYYSDLRCLLGWTNAKKWVMQRELMYYLPVILSSLLLNFRMSIHIK